MRRLLASVAVAAAPLVFAACASSTDGTEVAVTGTDTACTIKTDDVPAGKLAFVFTNDAKNVNELYVLREDGSVVGEVEDVTTGTNRTLNADLVAGRYALRCKPGQTGAGITTPFEVTGEGGTEQKAADRTITFTATDFTYEGLDLTTVTQGETIRFDMTNAGDQQHEFEVLGPDGEAVGEVEAVDPGKSGSATITFAEPGTYTYQCILADPATGKQHSMLGMKGTFDVAAK